MRTSATERDAAYIRSAERLLQRTEVAGRRASSASADTLMRNLARMTRLAKFYRDAYESLLGGDAMRGDHMPKIPEHAKMRAFHGGYPDEPMTAPTPSGGDAAVPLKDEDDFTHYFNATGRLSREVAALREENSRLTRTMQNLDDRWKAAEADLAAARRGEEERMRQIVEIANEARHYMGENFHWHRDTAFKRIVALAATEVPR